MAELEVGREMDAAVARILGWTQRPGWVRRPGEEHCEPVWQCGVEKYRTLSEWHPWASDTDALAALDVVLAK